MNALLGAWPAPTTFDLVAWGLLLAFTIWGFWRGLWSQLLSLLLLVVALLGAGWLGPRLERPLTQVVTLAPIDVAPAGWAAAALGLLIVGGVLARAFGALRLAPAFPPPLSRWVGAGLGLAKGAVVLVLLAYGLLYSELRAPGSAPLGGGGIEVFTREVPTGVTVRSLPMLRRLLTGGLGLPAHMERVARDVEAYVGGG